MVLCSLLCGYIISVSPPWLCNFHQILKKLVIISPNITSFYSSFSPCLGSQTCGSFSFIKVNFFENIFFLTVFTQDCVRLRSLTQVLSHWTTLAEPNLDSLILSRSLRSGHLFFFFLVFSLTFALDSFYCFSLNLTHFFFCHVLILFIGNFSLFYPLLFFCVLCVCLFMCVHAHVCMYCGGQRITWVCSSDIGRLVTG